MPCLRRTRHRGHRRPRVPDAVGEGQGQSTDRGAWADRHEQLVDVPDDAQSRDQAAGGLHRQGSHRRPRHQDVAAGRVAAHGGREGTGRRELREARSDHDRPRASRCAGGDAVRQGRDQLAHGVAAVFVCRGRAAGPASCVQLGRRARQHHARHDVLDAALRRGEPEADGGVRRGYAGGVRPDRARQAACRADLQRRREGQAAGRGDAEDSRGPELEVQPPRPKARCATPSSCRASARSRRSRHRGRTTSSRRFRRGS